MQQRSRYDEVRPRPHARAAGTRAMAWLLLSVAVPAAALTVASPGTLAAARAPGADSSALVAELALVLAWAVVARLAVTAVAVLLAHLPGAVGAAARRVAVVTSPAVLRSVVRVAAGATVAVVPLAATTAALADAGPSPTSTPASSVRILPTGELPVLDRIVPARDTDITDITDCTDCADADAGRRHPRSTSRRARSSSAAATPCGASPNSHFPAGRTDADVARAWPRWFASNRAVIGPDPSLIHPGEVLSRPT